MLAKIISVLALTLLLTGGASAFIPQPQESLQTELSLAEAAQQEQSFQTELVAAEPHNIYAGHRDSVEPSAVSEVSDVAELHNIYAGHSNSVEPQENLQTQLFAADMMLSDEPRQFD